LYGKWIQPKGKTVQEVGEMTILEQYLRMLSPELQVWIKEHNPKAAAEAASFADMFVAARRKGQPWRNTAMKDKDTHRPPPTQYHPRAASVSKPPIRDDQQGNAFAIPVRRTPVCYLCGQEGHTKPMCPRNSSKLTQMCFVP